MEATNYDSSDLLSICPPIWKSRRFEERLEGLNRAGVQIRGSLKTSHEDACAIGSRFTRSYLKRLHHVTTPTEQICHVSTLAINVQLCHHQHTLPREGYLEVIYIGLLLLNVYMSVISQNIILILQLNKTLYLYKHITEKCKILCDPVFINKNMNTLLKIDFKQSGSKAFAILWFIM